ncbi:porin [Robbsia sp. Bb-Pol-6]|uniref:Porin n=1 Tax=Robbsia betulipollinis TaxID=2981849 RepID=A0ABT3ZH88_9BURK|nr:porin [Robbsia betulipollinis]MCY0385894.1 porin [Robbsia betulipollinis]
MKPFVSAVLSGAVATAAAAVPMSSYAQSSVTLYGVIDEAIRFDTHQSASGAKLFTMGSGGELSGSRWGLQGTEDLGSGMQAVFQLEGGFTPNTGAFQQSTPSGATRLFGRTAMVGLSTNAGTIALGRQYTLVHEMAYTHDIYALSNYTGTTGFQGAGETGGGRLDNTVRYTSPTLYGFTARGAYTFGGVAGDTHRNASPAVSLSFDQGPLSVGAAYQVINDIGGLTPSTSAYGSTYFGVTIPDSSQKVFTVGAVYKLTGKATLYASYIYDHVYPADYRNDSFSTALAYSFSPSFRVLLPVYIDVVKHANAEGTRITTGPTFDYLLSKRTDVYLGIDYNHLTGAWVTLAAASGANQPFYGHNSLFETTIGLRHKF